MRVSWIKNRQSILQNKEGGDHNECYPTATTIIKISSMRG
ncbi:unnamed protein product [Schistosoma mattheei]|uniref:Uncharacterized protein n=1 Tax=Schistosoma mattheei TaxID=31246 RepID=A0A183PG74_9TREM|nr:unnamed protein product [Schistosoma mattheei]